MRPSDFPKDLRQNSYMARILPIIRDSLRGQTELIKLRSLLSEKPTVAEALILSRMGKGQFRESLLEREGRCFVTGIADARLLRASHVKPWHLSSNHERLDPANGLLLSPVFDHLFDRALISFEDDGTLLVAKSLSRATLQALGVNPAARGRALSGDTRAYMAFHRTLFCRQ